MNNQNMPVIGGTIIAYTLFFIIVFSASSILSTATYRTLGIITSLSTIAFLLLILAVLFFLA